jgi:general secretion pathway protein G
LHGEVDIFSLGADGQPGGAGNDVDIGSWDL